MCHEMQHEIELPSLLRARTSGQLKVSQKVFQ